MLGLDPAPVILHVDMDAFYAAVEARENPALAGKPLIVGHPGPRGVVSTCSYEARRYGVRSAMPSVRAMRLCPQAIWVHGRMELYAAVSRSIRRLMRSLSPLVEPLSIDEAFIDLTGIARDLDEGAATARRLKDAVREAERLTASVGVAPNKFLAKVASDLDKPDGLVVLPLERVPERLWPLPVERLWGVGPKTAERLRRGGLRLVGDVARCSADALSALVGPGSAAHLRALAHGEDARAVTPGRRARSISEERTYGKDLVAADDIDRQLLARAEGVARRLRQAGLVCRTVQLKLRAGDFTTWTRARTLPDPTDLAEPILAAARALLGSGIPLGGRGVRLIGIGASGLEPAGSGQDGLFREEEERLPRKLARASDAVRNKLGEGALTRARLLRRRRRDGAEPEEASSLPSVD